MVIVETQIEKVIIIIFYNISALFLSITEDNQKFIIIILISPLRTHWLLGENTLKLGEFFFFFRRNVLDGYRNSLSGTRIIKRVGNHHEQITALYSFGSHTASCLFSSMSAVFL